MRRSSGTPFIEIAVERRNSDSGKNLSARFFLCNEHRAAAVLPPDLPKERRIAVWRDLVAQAVFVHDIVVSLVVFLGLHLHDVGLLESAVHQFSSRIIYIVPQFPFAQR